MLRRAIRELVSDCRAIGKRLSSNEQKAVTEADLIMLRAQLFLIDAATANLLELKRLQRSGEPSDPDAEPTQRPRDTPP